MISFTNKHFGLRCCVKFLLYLFLLFFTLTLTDCAIIERFGGKNSPAKVKKSLDKKREEREKERKEAREKFREEFYKKQAPSTQKWMDYNAKQSEEWRKKFHTRKPPLLQRIRSWIEEFFGLFKKQEKGLFDNELKR